MKYWRELLILLLIIINVYLFKNREIVRPEIKVELSDRIFPSELKMEGKFAVPAQRIIYRQVPVEKMDTVACPRPVNMKLYGLLPENYATWRGDRLRITFFQPESGRFVQEDYALRVQKPDGLLSATVGLNYYSFSLQKRFAGNIYGGVNIALVNRKIYPGLSVTMQF